METIMYFWEATSDRQKVNERFLNDLASSTALALTYDKEFNAESVRKVLSAITNREPFRPQNRQEGRFFNNNLWMLEDLSLARDMMKPIKVLNLEHLSVAKEVTVYFAPLHLEDSYIVGDAMVLNFFRLQPSDEAAEVGFAGVGLSDYIAKRLHEVVQ
jgi:hypothetical protein